MSDFFSPGEPLPPGWSFDGANKMMKHVTEYHEGDLGKMDPGCETCFSIVQLERGARA